MPFGIRYFQTCGHVFSRVCHIIITNMAKQAKVGTVLFVC